MRGDVTVTAFGMTDPGKVRQNNEDALCIAELGQTVESGRTPPPGALAVFDAAEHAVLLAVSDGVGGAEAGEVASALVLESLRRAMREQGGDADFGDVVKRAVERANRDVWDAARAPGKRGMGATVTAVCVHGDRAHIAEVGDSRAYILRAGRIRQITKDQSFVQYLIDAGALTAEEAEQNPLKNVVLQAMGQRPDVQVALGRLELRRGDKLLLCSDGLSGPVSSTEMLSTIQQATSLEEACRALVNLANEHGGPDNVTVVLASVHGEGLSPPRDHESVTQTLKVVQEYTGTGRTRREDDDEVGVDPAAQAAFEKEQPTATQAAEPAKAGGMGRQRIDARLVTLAVIVGLAVGLLVFLLQRL
jgi:serine/threonine protein phosphatase PrpC